MTDKAWEVYEHTARYLLDTIREELGLQTVEGKQSVPGHESGTDWEIDAKGVPNDGESFVVIECRRHTGSALNQESIAALAYRISDAGASGGIIVSPVGLQAGAKKIAAASQIVEMKLDPDSTPQDFAMRFLKRLMIGVQDTVGINDHLNAGLRRTCKECCEQFAVQENESVCPDCSSAKN